MNCPACQSDDLAGTANDKLGMDMICTTCGVRWRTEADHHAIRPEIVWRSDQTEDGS